MITEVHMLHYDTLRKSCYSCSRGILYNTTVLVKTFSSVFEHGVHREKTTCSHVVSFEVCFSAPAQVLQRACPWRESCARSLLPPSGTSQKSTFDTEDFNFELLHFGLLGRFATRGLKIEVRQSICSCQYGGSLLLLVYSSSIEA